MAKEFAQDPTTISATTMDEEIHVPAWRRNPVRTFSDFTIKIFVDSGCTSTCQAEEGTDSGTSEKTKNAGEESAIYHVHKYVVGCGQRKSKYFARAFLDELAPRSTALRLHPLLAKHLPLVLDYIYSKDKPLSITTETAAALHHLGSLLEIHELCYDSMVFIDQDVSMDNIELYYQHAKLLCNYSLLESLARFIGNNIRDVGLDSTILKKISQEVWIKAFKSTSGTKMTKLESQHRSKLVCQLKRYHEFDPRYSDEMMEADNLPYVDVSVALALAEFDDKQHRRDNQTGDAASTKAGKDKNIAPGQSSLQSRCALALAESWKETLLFEVVTRDLLANRSLPFLVDFAFAGLKQAKEELGKAKQETQFYKDALKKTQQAYYRRQHRVRRQGPRSLRRGPSEYQGLRIGAGADAFKEPDALPANNMSSSQERSQ